MNKYLSISLYGYTLMISGVVLFFTENSNFEQTKTIIGIGLIIGALLAIISAFSSQRKQVQFAYHEMHALTMLVYSVTILVFVNSLENLISLSTFLFVFYTFSEIIFCNWLFNLTKNINYKVLIVRLLIAVIVGFGSIITIFYPNWTFEIFGLLFILIGLNIMLYIPIMKNKYFTFSEVS
jgi:uncharacterized membrane protein HdeD (DUF308 family)